MKITLGLVGRWVQQNELDWELSRDDIGRKSVLQSPQRGVEIL